MKITNKQGVVPNPRKHHHVQGLTCDCRQCGVEFTQCHNNHTFCSEHCAWKYRGVTTSERTCSVCGVTEEAPTKGKSYWCSPCRKRRLNPDRDDVRSVAPSESP